MNVRFCKGCNTNPEIEPVFAKYKQRKVTDDFNIIVHEYDKIVWCVICQKCDSYVQLPNKEQAIITWNKLQDGEL